MPGPPLPPDATGRTEPHFAIQLPDSALHPSCSEDRNPSLASPNDIGLSDYTPAVEIGDALLGSAIPCLVPLAPLPAKILDDGDSAPLEAIQSKITLPPTSCAALDLDLIQQGSIASIAPAKHGLRLPSFEALGIAAPHPDRKPSDPNETAFVGSGPLSKPGDPLHLLSPTLGEPAAITRTTPSHPDNPPLPSADAAQKQLTHYVPTFTPPNDSGSLRWTDTYANVTTSAMESPAHSDPERTTPTAVNTREGVLTSNINRTIPAPTSEPHTPANGQWLENAMQVLCTYSRNFYSPSS